MMSPHFRALEMPDQTPARASFFRSLLRDPTANTIVISAVSLLPLMAMVGGAIDASRYYMAASRLQAACDAGRAGGTASYDNIGFHRGTPHDCAQFL